jgi:hypothetical protein
MASKYLSGSLSFVALYALVKVNIDRLMKNNCIKYKLMNLRVLFFKKKAGA